MLTVATWNVDRLTPRSWRRLPVVRQALAARKHDVLVLTETHTHVAPRSGMRLSAQSARAPDRTPDERWVCIWTAEPLPASALELLGEPERSAAALVEPTSGLPVIVFGSVLPWRSDSRRGSRRGGAAFEESLSLQSSDLLRLREMHPDARLSVLGDLNQEYEVDGPVGTPSGRRALHRFLEQHGLVAVTGGPRDPLRVQGWRDSIDHILLDAASAASALDPQVWPDVFPLPGAPWPDHHGVEVSLAAV